MNIAFFDATPNWSGGASRILFLAKELKKRNNNVLIICLSTSLLSKKAKEYSLDVENVNPWIDLGLISFIRIIYILKKHKIQIVDINSPKFYWIGLYAAKILGVKTIITRNVPYRKKGIKKIINGKLLFQQSDAVISLSLKVKREMEEDYKLKNIILIYDGVLTEKRELSFDEKENLRKKFGVSKNDIVFATIGRIEENKGQILCVYAFEEVVKYSKNVKLLIVGTGNEIYINKIRDLIKEKNLQDNIFLLGFIEEIFKIFTITDVLIHPSYFDNIPMSILEAFSYKIPVIATNVGGISEVVDDGVNGFLFKPGNISELIIKIKMMLETDYKKMGENGFIKVSSKFSKYIMLDNYQNLLNRLLS